MASAWRTVASRWAITIVVRSPMPAAIAAMTSRSDSASSEAVASSRTRICGVGRDGARDGDPLRLAARQAEPAFAKHGLVASRQLLDEVRGAGYAGGLPRCARGSMSSRPKPMLSPIDPVKSAGSWNTTPTWRRTCAGSTSAMSTSIDRDGALPREVARSPAGRESAVDLPAPDGPTSAVTLPASRREGHVAGARGGPGSNSTPTWRNSTSPRGADRSEAAWGIGRVSRAVSMKPKQPPRRSERHAAAPRRRSRLRPIVHVEPDESTPPSRARSRS